MKKVLLPIAAVAVLCAAIFSCAKSDEVPATNEVTQDVKDAIFRLGFTSEGVFRAEGGYIVEGDIFLSDEDLQRDMSGLFLRVGDEEQYRTTNLVTGLPRTITVSVSSQLSQAYVDATDEAINRYNAQNLQLTFQRIASNGQIKIVKGNGNFLASAGFPSGGNPYGQVKVNTSQMNGQPLNTKASIIAHEMGHCIGFRHTDYMNRAYSCGGSPVNEGSAGVGAIHIPGTPTGPDPNSWMLSCICSGCNRPFNNNDQAALNYLY